MIKRIGTLRCTKKVGGDFHSGNEKERRETSVIIPTCLQYSMVLPLSCCPSSCRLSPCFPLPSAVVDYYVFVTPSLDFNGAGRRRRHP